MGGEPWLIRKPFVEGPETVLKRHKAEILELTPDWPEIRIGDGTPVKMAGWPMPTNACTLLPFDDEQLVEMFGTDKPQSNLDEMAIYEQEFWDDIPRGEGHFFLLYRDDIPVEVCFLGYSFD